MGTGRTMDDCNALQLVRGWKGEQWRPIPDWEGFYEASNMGRIWSCKRVIELCDGRTKTVGGLMRKPKVNRQKMQLQVELSGMGRKRNRTVGHWVLLAFTGIRQPGFIASHKNGDWQDPRLENLEWAPAGQVHFTSDEVRDRNSKIYADKTTVACVTCGKGFQAARAFSKSARFCSIKCGSKFKYYKYSGRAVPTHA